MYDERKVRLASGAVRERGYTSGSEDVFMIPKAAITGGMSLSCYTISLRSQLETEHCRHGAYREAHDERWRSKSAIVGLLVGAYNEKLGDRFQPWERCCAC